MKMKFLNAFLILAGLFIFLAVVETQLSFSDASRHCENNVRKFVKDIDEAYKTQNIEVLEKLAYLARACYKDGELQSEIKTKIKIFRDNQRNNILNSEMIYGDNSIAQVIANETGKKVIGYTGMYSYHTIFPNLLSGPNYITGSSRKTFYPKVNGAINEKNIKIIH